MVRTTIAIAVIALGAATVIAQNPIQDTFDLEAREFSDLEMREYALDDLEARGFEDVDMDARGFEDEVIDARDVAPPAHPQDPLPAGPASPPPSHPSHPSGTSHPGPSDPHPAAAPAPHAKEAGGSPPATPAGDSPSPTPTSGSLSASTVTITATPTPTPCTMKELKHQMRQTEIEKAIAVLRNAYGRSDLTPVEKLKVKKAKKYLRRVRRRRVRKAKRTIKKCKRALRKAGLTVADCKAGADCTAALEAKHLTPAKCIAAKKFLRRVDKAKHTIRKAHKKAHKKKLAGQKVKVFHDFAELLPAPTKTVGSDGVVTLVVTPGPTCTATPSSGTKMTKHLVPRDIVDEEFGSVFAREYDFNNLD